VAPNVAIFNAKTMDEVVADSLSEGVISSIATSRMREFAVRVALGADRARVTMLVFTQGLRPTMIGLGCGLIAVYAAAPLVRTMPVVVRPPDNVTIASTHMTH
jgi:ABC-type lipoprotein release transport system permease subunit